MEVASPHLVSLRKSAEIQRTALREIEKSIHEEEIRILKQSHESYVSQQRSSCTVNEDERCDGEKHHFQVVKVSDEGFSGQRFAIGYLHCTLEEARMHIAGHKDTLELARIQVDSFSTEGEKNVLYACFGNGAREQYHPSAPFLCTWYVYGPSGSGNTIMRTFRSRMVPASLCNGGHWMVHPVELNVIGRYNHFPQNYWQHPPKTYCAPCASWEYPAHNVCLMCKKCTGDKTHEVPGSTFDTTTWMRDVTYSCEK